MISIDFHNFDFIHEELKINEQIPEFDAENFYYPQLHCCSVHYSYDGFISKNKYFKNYICKINFHMGIERINHQSKRNKK